MTPRLSAILADLARAGLVTRHGNTLPDQAAAVLVTPELHDMPWFVRLFVALGTWIGAALAASVALALELHEDLLLALPLGVALIAAAAVLGRRCKETLFLGQLAWVLVMGGQVLLLGAMAEASDSAGATAIAGLILAASCVAVLPQRWLRAASILGVVIALVAIVLVFEIPLGLEVLSAGITLAAVAVWIHEPRLCASRLGALWPALAYALALGLALPHALLVFSRAVHAGSSMLDAPWAVSLALAPVGVWIVHVAAVEQGQTIESPGRGPARWATLGLVLVAVLTRHVPGVIAAVLVLITAHLRRSRVLEVLAFLYLAAALFAFYYQLTTSLLTKSLWVLTTGMVLLLATLLLDRMAGMPRVAHARVMIDRAAQRRSLVLTCGLLAVCLAIPAGLVMHKERIVDTGTTVFLALQPRDPRSLMQGDYMVLRYALEDEILVDHHRAPAPGPGTLIIALDDRGVARFVRLEQPEDHDDGRGKPLAANEHRLRFRHVPDGSPAIRLGAESFFFAEGTAERYAAARYGQLAVAADGSAVLVALRDAELQVLGTALH